MDWVDHNIYVFKDHKLWLHSLQNPEYSAPIYNGSMNVRNLVVEYKQQFLAWIGNDNNIMRAGKVSVIDRLLAIETYCLCFMIRMALVQ